MIGFPDVTFPDLAGNVGNGWAQLSIPSELIAICSSGSSLATRGLVRRNEVHSILPWMSVKSLSAALALYFTHRDLPKHLILNRVNARRLILRLAISVVLIDYTLQIYTVPGTGRLEGHVRSAEVGSPSAQHECRIR